jgi:hypothetical protein
LTVGRGKGGVGNSNNTRMPDVFVELESIVEWLGVVTQDGQIIDL